MFLCCFLIPTVLPSLLFTSSAQGLGPVTASSFAMSEGSLGGQWDSPSAEGSWPVTGAGTAIHRWTGAAWSPAGTGRAELGAPMAEGSSSRLETRPHTAVLGLGRGGSWAALEQGKVTLACHPALNGGAVRATSRAWATGERDAGAWPVTRHPLSDRGLLPRLPPEMPLKKQVCVGGRGGVLPAGLSLPRAESLGTGSRQHQKGPPGLP